VLVWCKACRHRREVDLQALVDAAPRRRAAPSLPYPGSDMKSDKALGCHDPSAVLDCVTVRALRST
jgi:hypothetical protein